MKLFREEDFADVENQSPGRAYRQKILTGDDLADDLGGVFALIPPGVQVPFHYHVKRESILIFVSGEAVACIEDKEIPVGAGDVLYIPRKEKHRVSNRSGSVNFSV